MMTYSTLCFKIAVTSFATGVMGGIIFGYAAMVLKMWGK